jgi:hypothetical protein
MFDDDYILNLEKELIKMLNLVETKVETKPDAWRNTKLPYEKLEDYLLKNEYSCLDFRYFKQNLNNTLKFYKGTDVDTIIDKLKALNINKPKMLDGDGTWVDYPHYFEFFEPFEEDWLNKYEDGEEMISSIFFKDAKVTSCFDLFLNDFKILKAYLKEYTEEVVDIELTWEKVFSSGEEGVSLEEYDLDAIRSWDSNEIRAIFGEYKDFDNIDEETPEVSQPYLQIK